MVITRHGEGTFKIQTGGVSLVVDPSDNRLKADITIKTKTELPLENISGDPAEILGSGEYDMKGVKIMGFPTVTSGQKGVIETIYEVNTEGLALLFLGNPGTLPDITVREKLGDVDIVFAPPGSAKFIKQLEPSIIVPTYVKNEKSVDKDFGQKLEKVEKITIKKKDLPAQPVVNFIHG
jgi:hypothetical protein